MTTIIFGGSFDPVHKGHIMMAKYALEFTKAGRLIMIPAGVSPFKIGKDAASDRDRLQMCRLAAADEEKIQVSDIEFGLPKPSYTVNTLRALKKLYPEDQFILLCGADAFLSLKQWKDYRDILSMCDILTVARRGNSKDEIVKFMDELSSAANISIMEMPPVDVSSTEIRKAVKDKDKELLAEYLSSPVAEYILENHIYQE